MDERDEQSVDDATGTSRPDNFEGYCSWCGGRMPDGVFWPYCSNPCAIEAEDEGRAVRR